MMDVMSVSEHLKIKLTENGYTDGHVIGSGCSMIGNPVRDMHLGGGNKKITQKIINNYINGISTDYECKLKTFDKSDDFVVYVKMKDGIYKSLCGDDICDDWGPTEEECIKCEDETEKSIPIGEVCPRSIGKDCPYPLGTVCAECPKIKVEIDNDDCEPTEEECVKCEDEPEAVVYKERIIELTVYKDCLLKVISNLSKDKSVRRIDVTSFCAGSYELEIQIAEEA